MKDIRDFKKKLLAISDIEAQVKVLKTEIKKHEKACVDFVKENPDLFKNLPYEGSKTFHIDPFLKVEIVNKINRSLDYDIYRGLKLAKDDKFVKMKPTIDLIKFREVVERNKKVYDAVTEKPAATKIKVHIKKER